MARKLASIQKVKGIKAIPGADAIEIVQVLGWEVVAKKGEFTEGTKCVYFEVDSFLPIEEKYEFLRKSSYRNNDIMGEGFRLKTIKLRGQISQGLALPLCVFDGVCGITDLEVGTDVTALLKVEKWQQPEVDGDMGVMIGDKPYGIPTTDETRVQAAPEVIRVMSGKPYYITTKYEGTSVTFYNKDGKFGVCTRTNEVKDTEDSYLWNYARKHNIADILKGKNIAVQGELCGPKIQGNLLRLKELQHFVFNVYSFDDNKYLDYFEMVVLLKELGLEMVEVEETGDSFNYTTLEELLERAKGRYKSGNQKEGIVIRPLIETYSPELNGRLTFKIINNDYLLKEKG